ncbi:MAG: hypothetical protein ACXWPS_19990 [Ktedonobacteraceae bacterium]
MSYFDYPKVKHSLARTALQDPYPAWFVDTRGVILGANLMAFWISETVKFTEPINPDALLGRSMFSIFSNSFERIPIAENIECYSKKSSMVKRMKVNANVESPIYANFIAAMKTVPLLEKIYEEASLYPDDEWEHPLIIMSPEHIDTSRLLEFQVTIYRLEADVGFLSICIPTPTTLPDIEQQYGLLIEEYGGNAYVQLDDPSQDTTESNQIPFNFGTHFRAYYPSLIQDPLWYLMGENKAHQLLIGSSVVGAHFFDLFFAPQLHEWMGPIQETTAPRAIKYFTEFTSTFLNEEHEFHSQYEQTMARLMQLPDFRYMLEVSRKLPIRLYIPDNIEAPFYTCRVILPWSISSQIALQFRSMARIIHRNRMVHTDIRDYQVTLVPENYETEVALILLHLQSASQNHDADRPGFMTSLPQFLWLLSVMRTVNEGLARVDEDTTWEPESAFGRIYDKLTSEYSEQATDVMSKIVDEFRDIIETLDRKEIVAKENVLAMLYGFTSKMHLMDPLSEFLSTEIERYNTIQAM